MRTRRATLVIFLTYLRNKMRTPLLQSSAQIRPNRLPALCVVALGVACLAGSLPLLAQPRIGAHLQYDVSRFSSAPTPLQDTSGFRRARLSLSTGESGQLETRLQYDFEAQRFTDALIRWPLGDAQLLVGQFKPPFSADALLSDSQSFFTENATVGVFAPGRRLGLQYSRNDIALALFGRDAHGVGPNLAASLRGFRDFGGESQSWHVGASLLAERASSASRRIRLRPEAGPDAGSWVSSPSFVTDQNVTDQNWHAGIEVGHQRGNWLLLGELLSSRYASDSLDSRRATGGYLTSAWTLHGSPRMYKGGIFSDPKPLAGKLGSVELAVRYSSVALPSGLEPTAIGQHTLSIGLNAQIGSGWRLQLDRHDSRRDSDSRRAGLWTLRAQWLY